MKQPDNKKKKRRQYPMQKDPVPALDCVAHEPVLNDYGALRSIDLFAGAGGLSEGLSMAGFAPLFASELVDSYARTYQLNHPRTEVRSADIRSLDPKAIMKQIGARRGELDLIAGGPPCQGFSINAPVRSVLDQRNHLFKEYLRFVDAFQPRAVLIENVPGLVSFEHGATLHAILHALAELGYGADVHILGAAYYGVPQMRWRTIIIGLRGKTVPSYAFPEPVRHAPIRPNFTTTFDGKMLVKMPTAATASPFTTVQQAISDLPPLACGERGALLKHYATPPSCDYQRWVRIGSNGVSNHEASKLSAINLERLNYIQPGGNWTDIPERLLPMGMTLARKSDHTQRYGRPRPDGLASTILTKCDPHWGAYFHYAQNRSYTVREAARLQSFPDHFLFTGTMAEQFAQVGNAVPPLLAEAVGLTIKNVLNEGS
jgi:DNA (cytosine-5)-methyltransferase 1